MPKIVGQGWCQGFQASSLDGDQLRWFVVRLQRDGE
jgi:hypothetical protein